MRTTHLSYLRCPITHQPLKLKKYKQSGDHVTEGVLTSGLNSYPIIEGIPRLLTGDPRVQMLLLHRAFFRRNKTKLPARLAKEWAAELKKVANDTAFAKHQRKTAESFAYEWKTIYRENDFEKNNFFHFLSPYVKESDIRNKLTLDIGCGSGRFTKQAALAGAKVAYGSDLGESVAVAYKLTKNLPNACIVQADIYNMPFYHTFDLAYSIGVLHHLPQPEEGFRRLPPVLKPNGRFLIWVYNRRNNGRAIYFYEPLRAVLKHLPKPLLYRLCYPPALAVQLINYVSVALRRLGHPQAATRVPFSYYANFPFNMKLNDAFDVLATPKSNYYFWEDIDGWFKRAKLAETQTHEHPEAGITATGRYGKAANS